jgi:O-antigen ligase
VAGILGFLIIAAVLVIPFWRILPRAGLPAPVALVAVIPLGAVILLWVLAFRRWPLDDVSGRF